MGCAAKRSSTNTCCRSDSGFTLLEVVAALSLSVVLLSVLSQFLYNGARLWYQNDRAYRRQHLQNAVYGELSREIETALSSGFLPEASLVGDSERLSFWRETDKGLQQVSYRYDSSEHLLYRQAGFFGEKAEETPEFKEITQWEFEYYDPGSRNWKDVWKPECKDEVPSLIRVTASTATANLGEMVIPILVWRDKTEEDDAAAK